MAILRLDGLNEREIKWGDANAGHTLPAQPLLRPAPHGMNAGEREFMVEISQNLTGIRLHKG